MRNGGNARAGTLAVAKSLDDIDAETKSSVSISMTAVGGEPTTTSSTASKRSDSAKFEDETSDIMHYLIEHIHLVEEALDGVAGAKTKARRCSEMQDSLEVRRIDNERVHLNALRMELKNIRTFAVKAQSAVKVVDDMNASTHKGTLCSAFLWGCVVFLVLSARLFVGVSVPIEYDASTVDCWNINELSGVVISISLVWVAAKIADYKFLPHRFPATHLVMGTARRVKAVGNCIKCLGRFAVLVFLSALWQRFSLDSGLNLGESICENVSDAIARKIFYGSKALFLSIMVWECSASPRMSVDIWIHHLVLIYAVALTTDSNLHVGGSDFEHLSTNEGFGMILMYGTAFNCLKEAYIGAFQHSMVDDKAQQFRQLRMAVIAHVVNQTIFYFLLPAVFIVVASMKGNMDVGQVVLFSLALTFLNALEVYILRITTIVARKRQRQAKIPTFWTGFPAGIWGN